MRGVLGAQAALWLAVAIVRLFSGCGSSDSDGTTSDAGPETDAPPGAEAQRLSETGLYSDIAAKQPSSEALEYTPSHALWSDGADKKRWIVLPAGARIDTSDMDHWRFPVGTKLFKEFARDGRRLETRLIEHVTDTGKVEADYRASTFVWRGDESDADLVINGAKNVRGTDHDVPSREDCWKCHNGEAGRVLGFSAIQLSQPAAPASAVNLRWLAGQGKLTAPPASDADFSVPGDAATSRALGYLHANCGHCHNENGTAWPDNQMVLRLSVSERTAASTGIYASTVGIKMQRPKASGDVDRVVAGHPEQSGLVYRMSKRDGTSESMPPIASKKADADGISALTSWIQGL